MSIEENRPHYLYPIIYILLLILIISAVVYLVSDSNQEETELIEMENRSEFLESRKQLENCITDLFDIAHKTLYYQCPNGTTTQHVSIACRSNCTPVLYPGEWNCTLYQDHPGFERLGAVPVNHDGFDNWSWPNNIINHFLVNQSLFERLYARYDNMTATCGYLITHDFGRSRNLSQAPCKNIGETQSTTRGGRYDQNYFCCLRRSINHKNYCRLITNVREELICQCVPI